MILINSKSDTLSYKYLLCISDYSLRTKFLTSFLHTVRSNWHLVFLYFLQNCFTTSIFQTFLFLYHSAVFTMSLWPSVVNAQTILFHLIKFIAEVIFLLFLLAIHLWFQQKTICNVILPFGYERWQGLCLLCLWFSP